MDVLETLLRGLPQALASGLVYGSIYALIAQGYYVTFSTTQTLNFAQGDFLMIGGLLAFTVFGAMLSSGLPLVVSLLAEQLRAELSGGVPIPDPVADVVAETGDTSLLDTLQTLWSDVVTHKMYITGACGALYDGASPDGSPEQASITRVHQAYGRAYQLPNATAHSDTWIRAKSCSSRWTCKDKSHWPIGTRARCLGGPRNN